MDVKTLRDLLASVPDEAQVNVQMSSGIEWAFDRTSFDPTPEVVPGTYGQVMAPTFRIHLDD